MTKPPRKSPELPTALAKTSGDAAIDKPAPEPEVVLQHQHDAEPHPAEHHAFVVSEYTYSSPLPPSSELRAYEAAVPGSGKMIFSNARHMMKVSSEIRRRQAADDSALMQAQIEQMRSDARLRERGQSAAFWLAALSIVVFGALIYFDKNGWAFGLLITTVGGFITATVFSRRDAPALPPPQVTPPASEPEDH